MLERPLAVALVLIVMLIGFTVMQHAFAGGGATTGVVSDVERRALALTGEAIDGGAAERIGLVDERTDDPARCLAARVKYLLRCSPDAVTRLKRFSAAIAGLALPDALAAGVARTSGDVARPEVRAAVAGFLAGELPPWAARPGDRR